MSDGIEVDEKGFEGLNHDDQIRAIFQAIVATNQNITNQKLECEPRFKCLENRKWRDKGIAGGAGLVGGFIAAIGKKLFLP